MEGPRTEAQQQRCLDLFSRDGEWAGDVWAARSDHECRWRPVSTGWAQSALRGQHIMIVGDLHARLFYSALIYLLNGTASPDEVAEGYMRHKWSAESPCAWRADRQASKWYDWAGWGEFPKTHSCHVTAYGWPNLHNVTLPRATSWWGNGDARDVQTMLQKESLRFSSFTRGSTTVSYVWRSQIRTVGHSLTGAYRQQHARVMDKVAKEVGRGPPTLVVAAMYAFDAQWQGAEEVEIRQRGLYYGIKERWPATPVLALGPSSCQPARPYSVYMGSKSRHNIFHRWGRRL